MKSDIDGNCTSKLYDNRNDFNFSIVICPSLCSNISSPPAYIPFSLSLFDTQWHALRIFNF